MQVEIKFTVNFVFTCGYYHQVLERTFQEKTETVVLITQTQSPHILKYSR